jgi:formylglycine-generating enzyme required for sulfatase activity
LRGGSWDLNPDSCRSALRHYFDFPALRYYSFGFRVALSVAEP